MKPKTTALWISIMLSMLVVSCQCAHAQGTSRRTVTFGGSPEIQPHYVIGIRQYYEEGLKFTAIESGGMFTRSGGESPVAAYPRNGGAYIQACYTDSLSVTYVPYLTARPFSLVSVDLAEWSTLYAMPWSVLFVGYKPDGSTVTTELITDGIIDGAGPLNDFETFYFDSRFANIVKLEIPTVGWCLDNMVFSTAVPEPGTGSLLVIAGVGLFLRALRDSSRRVQAGRP